MSWKDLSRVEKVVGIERRLDALHQRDLVGDNSIAMNGALEKPMPCSPLIEPSIATTPSNNSRSASCARWISSRSFGSTMMFTWMFPSPAWPKHGMRSRSLCRDRWTSVEQRRDSRLWHDHVVVELQSGNHLERQRQLAADPPQFLTLRLIAGAEDFGRACCAFRASAMPATETST